MQLVVCPPWELVAQASIASVVFSSPEETSAATMNVNAGSIGRLSVPTLTPLNGTKVDVSVPFTVAW